MTVYSNDPIRIRLTLDDLWNMTHQQGIDSCAYASPEDPNEYFIKFCCSDTNPYNPQEEKYKEDLEKEIEKFRVVQDRIREFKPNRLFNSTNKGITKEAILDTKVFGKENRYDVLLDKAKNVHKLKNNGNGNNGNNYFFFGVIENE